MRRTGWFAIHGALALTALGLAGCGSSSKTTSHTAASRPPASTTPSTAVGPSAVTANGIHATLHGASHDPVAGKNWVYTLTVQDAAGHPLSGIVTTEFAFGGQVEGRETPPTHRLKNGHLRDIIQYPARSEGVPLTMLTVVRTPAGTVTLGWPITVKP